MTNRRQLFRRLDINIEGFGQYAKVLSPSIFPVWHFVLAKTVSALVSLFGAEMVPQPQGAHAYTVRFNPVHCAGDMNW